MMSGDRQIPQTPENDSARASVALVYSPHAGSAERANPAELLRSVGLDIVDVLLVTRLNRLNPNRLAERWRAAGARAIVAAGGDGSVGSVATLAGLADLPLGIIPLGTANDIARALALPEDPAAAANLIAQCLVSGEERLIDAGELVPAPGAPSSPGARGGHFLHALTLGINVEFARLATDVEQRRRWGRLTYAASALESLNHFTPVPVTLIVEGMEGQPEGVTQTITTRVALLAAINLPVFGGRMELRLLTVREDDGLLDFFLIEAPEFQDLASLSVTLGNLFTPASSGTTLGGRWFRARSVTILTPTPVEVTLDGELRGQTPVIARIAPRPARILAPHARVAPRATLKSDSSKTTTDVDKPSSGTV
jgi:diacylglycerol kinase (ATP)